MAEHLAVVSPRTLRRLLRTKVLTWTRRRREAPVGRVHIGDQVFFKYAGQRVIAAGTVARVKEGRAGGRYALTLRFRQFRKLPVAFPIVKRDRRSWVVCASDDPRQQRLLRAAALTITELLQAIRTRHSRLPSRQAVRKLLAAYATQPGTDASLLVWLALLAAAPGSGELDDVLRGFLRKPTRRVFPLAVFS
ncbi:MAG: hypothetical protein G01um101438_471 [Parcubacteria group bacterium Gr01-1014_38]|nr:MAG: hypothetical protein G01um101438_471 [Parcubacteria group bacterium Gr01-1014_38]